MREELLESRKEVEELKQADAEMRERLKKIQLQQTREKKERFDPIGQPPDKASAKKKYEKEEKALKETVDDILGPEEHSQTEEESTAHLPDLFAQ